MMIFGINPDAEITLSRVMFVPNGVTALLMASCWLRVCPPNMQVNQASQIQVGQPCTGYVEIVTDGCAADDSCAVLTVDEFLGNVCWWACRVHSRPHAPTSISKLHP